MCKVSFYVRRHLLSVENLHVTKVGDRYFTLVTESAPGSILNGVFSIFTMPRLISSSLTLLLKNFFFPFLLPAFPQMRICYALVALSLLAVIIVPIVMMSQPSGDSNSGHSSETIVIYGRGDDGTQKAL